LSRSTQLIVPLGWLVKRPRRSVTRSRGVTFDFPAGWPDDSSRASAPLAQMKYPPNPRARRSYLLLDRFSTFKIILVGTWWLLLKITGSRNLFNK